MKKLLVPLACAGSILCASVLAAEPFPFVLPWDDASAGVTDLSGMLEKPAGAQGFIAAREGHLFAGEKRVRIFGVNVAFGGNFPSHEDAEKVAARMAKFGINCVRFHHMDTGTAPAGLLEKDRRTLNAEALDRLDYFIARLKEHGVYANLNLHVGNEYPGMTKWEGTPNYFKGVDNFYPPMIEQQREYARKLLTHVNPYTKRAYADEPAVALIEINNENGLIMEWNNGTLDEMPDPYAADLRQQWNAWLAKKYSTDVALSAAFGEGEERLGAEKLENHRFADGFNHWNLEQHEGAKAATEMQPIPGGDGARLVVKVEAPGKEAWHVQFTQGGLAIEQGRSYSVTLSGARASKPEKIHVNLGQTRAPWKVLASQEVKLTTEPRDIEFVLVPSEADAQARLSVSDLGREAAEFSFSQISLRPGGTLGLLDGEKLGSVEILRKKNRGRRTPVVQADWNRFLIDTELAYWPGMSRFIKEELGAKSLVLGSATGFSPWIVQSKLDVVDAHSYWQHPHFPHRPWDMDDWTVKNESMAGAPDGGALTTLAMRRVAGKPFIVTEYNHASPNTFSSEGFLEVCTLAALQDWDGVFAFAYCHRLNDWGPGRITSFFDIDQHPAKMATLPAALTLFYRADLQPAWPARIVEVTPDEAIESIRKGSDGVEARAYGIAQEEMFQHPVAMRLGHAPVPGVVLKPVRSPSATEGGVLTWDTAARRMTLASPRSVMAVGKVSAGEKITLGEVTIVPGATMQDWATITLTVVDGDSFAKARRILVTATGYAGNADMKWKDAGRTSVGREWGKGPSVVEGIPMKVTFAGDLKLHAWALNDHGQRKGEIPVSKEGGKVAVELSPEQKTLWWELAEETGGK